MKSFKLLSLISGICILYSCQKNLEGDIVAPADNYLSTQDFFKQNEAALQTYTVNGTAGGTFTSPQGTKVTVPSAAFVSVANGTAVTANVIIQFKDIYKKSDMLLSQMPTATIFGNPLKSGGEFFIKALADNIPVQLAPGKKIMVDLPAALTGGIDDVNRQVAFVMPDTVAAQGNINPGWRPSASDSVNYSATGYIFSLYSFKAPADSGTWCNSDNQSYFNAYPQTTLTLKPKDDAGEYRTEVFLLFKNIASMVHVYANGNEFPYSYAPAGLQCTLVATGVKNGKLYAAFVPITIAPNQSVDFTLSLTNTDDFVAQLKALD